MLQHTFCPNFLSTPPPAPIKSVGTYIIRCFCMHNYFSNKISYKKKSSAHTWFLDAAKAFDEVSHWTLFSKLINRNIPLVIAFCYQTQPMCIK